MANNRPIGVYDSGMGGLTVWREIRRLLPRESLIYLGDGKNCPYGSRPAGEVRRLADESVARPRRSTSCAGNTPRCPSWAWSRR